MPVAQLRERPHVTRIYEDAREIVAGSATWIASRPRKRSPLRPSHFPKRRIRSRPRRRWPSDRCRRSARPPCRYRRARSTPALPAAGGTQTDHAELIAIDASHYVLSHEIARGGMGRIRVARDRRLGRMVAVKEILVRDGDLARRFEREARITAKLQHPSIVSVYEAGTWPSGMPFYAMPLVKGRSLDEVIAENKTLDERMALLPNVLAVADAIAYAHGERVIHRDLKPKNVLVGSFGETVVIDWGLAKDLDSPELAVGARGGGSGLETELGEVMGTPAYMPPEQAEGQTVDERADVYAIGALLTHVLCGKPPYEGRSAIELLGAVKAGPPTPLRTREPSAPADLIAIVERAMARDRSARYPTARELAEDLRRFQTGQLVGAHHYSLRQLIWRWAARHRAPLAVGAIAAAILIAVGVFAVRGIVEERRRADAQRTIAVDSRGVSEGLTQFMLFDMHDKLEGVGRLDLLAAVADKAARTTERAARTRRSPTRPAQHRARQRRRRDGREGRQSRRAGAVSRSTRDRAAGRDPRSGQRGASARARQSVRPGRARPPR